jgi:hypothetical protein
VLVLVLLVLLMPLLLWRLKLPRSPTRCHLSRRRLHQKQL